MLICGSAASSSRRPSASACVNYCSTSRLRQRSPAVRAQVGEDFAASLVGREVDVLVDGYNDDGWLMGRTQWDAPDVDPLVFLSEPTDSRVPPLEVGQVRRCVVYNNSLFDLEAHPIS